MAKTGSRSFGAFRGVFIPTFLTIIGVILYLRLGTIVGQAGILGSIVIILLAVSVTICTGLSLSSITSNIRIGSGGAFSIISKTLGLEIGGSVGIPLFLAQAFSVVLYVFGFTETWKFIFPEHSRFLILYTVFALLFLLTFINIKHAIRAQMFVFFLVLASLVSIFAGGGWWSGSAVLITSNFEFWKLFALFFPAVTGLMAGVGMSGELSNPKEQIPKGILSALGVTTLIYILMVFWLGFSSNPSDLVSDSLIMAKLALNSPLVLAGVLAATFSSALTTLIAAPRLLQALAENSTFFFNKIFAKKTKSGEPRNATMFTALIIIVSLSIGNLDSIAPVLTMFFLITYAMINIVVLLEQLMGFVSFRPTFRIPKLVPLYGFTVSVLVMFYINIIAGVIAIILLMGVYVLLAKRKLKAKKGYVRSGLLTAVSEWVARHVQKLSESGKHTWKPNILLPLTSSNLLAENIPLIKAIIYPQGNLSILGMKVKQKKYKVNKVDDIPSLMDQLKQGIFTSYAHVECDKYVEGVDISLQALESQFFHPNILFLPFSVKKFSQNELKSLFRAAEEAKAGIIFYDKNKKFRHEDRINIWLPGISDDLFKDKIYDLAMLIAYTIQRNWVCKIRLIISADKKKEREKAKRFLRKLIYEARFPHSTEIKVGKVRKSKKELHIIPVADYKDLKKRMLDNDKTILYVYDSTQEDVLA